MESVHGDFPTAAAETDALKRRRYSSTFASSTFFLRLSNCLGCDDPNSTACCLTDSLTFRCSLLVERKL
eukprot:6249630-Amphidinium_carterae.1